jgi:hypothetical protein
MFKDLVGNLDTFKAALLAALHLGGEFLAALAEAQIVAGVYDTSGSCVDLVEGSLLVKGSFHLVFQL